MKADAAWACTLKRNDLGQEYRAALSEGEPFALLLEPLKLE
jgi:hypothetical protein